MNTETKSPYLTEIFPLDGLIISILLTTSPSLIAAYLIPFFNTIFIFSSKKEKKRKEVKQFDLN